MNRRQLLKTTAAASAAFTTFPILGAQSPGKKTSLALIGTGWWGMNILGAALEVGGCKVVAMCDVDERQLQPALARVQALTGDQPRPYRDYRELLQKEKPEIAIVATPDHWHPLIMIEAVKAGAHVYVEKPIGHTIREGRAMVNAARATGKTVQVGTHRRISPHNVSAREFIRSGKLGQIGAIRAFIQYGGGPESPRPNVEPPKALDWDFWCGPAPLRPFNGSNDPDQAKGGGIHPKGFRSYLDYANGTLGDWGVHWLDQILWIMEQEKWPRKVFSTGGRPVKGPAILTDKEQTSDAPDSQVAVYEFANFNVTWEHRLFAGNNHEKTESVGCYFFGTKGVFHLGWKGGWTFFPQDKKAEPVFEAPRLNPPDDQNIRELWVDFLAAINNGKRPLCDIEEIHYATNLSLLGMLSMKLGRSVQWDGQKEEFPGDAEANRLLQRDYRGSWVYPG